MTEPANFEDAGATKPTQTSNALFEQVYERLKAMAANQLRAAVSSNTLNTTMLVHELYLRIGNTPDFNDARQFFAYAARAMRHILIDRARARLSEKGGGHLLRVELPESESAADDALALDSAELAITLTNAIEKLAELDARAAEVVELRYFTGLTLEQIAETMGLTRRTIDRDWRFARAFLKSAMTDE